jgi:GalNAc-alpha-(1->4)-GalNAc-alpha-(1->3)-diNAcBac-PP-undecaprenol alpha-1,4-N-acetyl-D-galactosaminyltransferase
MSRSPIASLEGRATRVLVLFGSDGIGGIERRLSILTDAFEEVGLVCELVALTGASAERGLLSHRSITVLDPVRSRSPWRSLRRAGRLRRLIHERRIEAVLAFGHFANALASVAAAGLGVHVVLSEIVSPFTSRRRLWNRTVMHSYALADSLVLQTDRLAADIAALPGPPRRLVIANPIALDLLDDTAPPVPRAPRIIASGRLVRHKRYHDLVEAFALLAPEFPEWSVEILGDGPERGALARLVQARGLDGRVTLAGHVQQPWVQMRQARIVAHCAEIEGFCNTLVEALAAGCAVVSSDCPYGPREILGDTGNLLYPPGDVGALAAQLRLMMSDAVRCESAARTGRASLERFTVTRIRQQWLDELAHGRPSRP